MTLSAGTRLGPYEILAAIGAGGMREVYRARDTRLERTVAVKVLGSQMASSPRVRQRFEREAKTISKLSHPHICALYDVGREGEIEYLVMELLEGETLADRLTKGPLPLENYVTAQWFRDGKTVLICGNEPGKETHFYVQEIGGGAPRPVTPEGTRDGWLSPDGTLVLARGSGGTYSLYPIAGGEPRPVPGLAEGDVVAQWSTDGRSVLAYRRAEIPCRLERVDLGTGQRSLFKNIAPADSTGLLSMRGIFVTDDLRSYAYTTYYQVSSLFVSERRE